MRHGFRIRTNAGVQAADLGQAAGGGSPRTNDLPRHLRTVAAMTPAIVDAVAAIADSRMRRRPLGKQPDAIVSLPGPTAEGG
jgi:hypothetical protein